jgi:3-methyladenine DNA glycosylase AlkD
MKQQKNILGPSKQWIKSANEATHALRALASPARALVSARFFKTGPGQYGEGDRFIGVRMPDTRRLAKKCAKMRMAEVQKLLHSPVHEDRMLALLSLVEHYRAGNEKTRKTIFHRYLEETKHINNWDLVDVTAEHIIGAHSVRHASLLPRLARSSDLWERRIAILSTFFALKRHDAKGTLLIASLLLHDPHDLIHKAVGWMLREMGKHCGLGTLRSFLASHAYHMPRTMLRYAIERLPVAERKRWMKQGLAKKK